MNDFFRLCLVYLGFSIIIDTFFVCLIGPCTVISSHSMYMGGRWSSLYRANIIKWKISVCVDAVAFIGRMKLPANLLCLFGTQKGIFLGRRNKNKNIEIKKTTRLECFLLSVHLNHACLSVVKIGNVCVRVCVWRHYTARAVSSVLF